MQKQLVIALTACILAAPASALGQELGQLRQAAAAKPPSASAVRAYGRALIEAGKLAEAEAQMTKLARLQKGAIEALYEQARVKFEGGSYRKSRAFCRTLQKADAQHVLSHVCMARAFLVWRRASRAIEHIDAAFAADPTHPQALLVRADAERIRGARAAALAAYKKALTHESVQAEAYLGLGLLHLVSGTQEQARQALRKAYGLRPNAPRVQLELGKLLGDTEGVALIEQALAVRPKLEGGHLALGQAKLAVGDSAGAETLFKQLLRRDRRNAEAQAGLGRIALLRKKYNEAESALGKALELRPTHVEAVLSLAEVYAATERTEDAFTQYNTAASLRPRDPAPLVEAARLALRGRRPLLASAFLDKALERQPQDAPALALYGDIAQQRGNRTKARKLYNRALSGTGSVDRKHIQAQLQALK